jgi:hypothetical protein
LKLEFQMFKLDLLNIDGKIITTSYPKILKNGVYSIENANNRGFGISSKWTHRHFERAEGESRNLL